MKVIVEKVPNGYIIGSYANETVGYKNIHPTLQDLFRDLLHLFEKRKPMGENVEEYGDVYIVRNKPIPEEAAKHLEGVPHAVNPQPTVPGGSVSKIKQTDTVEFPDGKESAVDKFKKVEGSGEEKDKS